MSVDAMSEDETEHVRGEPRYVVRTPAWRDPQISVWLQTFDALHLSTRFNPDNTAKRGKFPRLRIRNTNRGSIKGKPVPGLPSNFYRKQWLAKCDKFELRALDIQPPLDLSFSPYIMR